MALFYLFFNWVKFKAYPHNNRTMSYLLKNGKTSKELVVIYVRRTKECKLGNILGYLRGNQKP
jgi:hypothetical protein